MTRILLAAAGALALAACASDPPRDDAASPHTAGERAAVADAALPEVRYYMIADT